MNLMDLLSQLLASPTATALVTLALTLAATKYPWLSALLAILKPTPTPAPVPTPVPGPGPAPNHPVLNELLMLFISGLLVKHQTQDPAVAVARELAMQRAPQSPPQPSP